MSPLFRCIDLWSLLLITDAHSGESLSECIAVVNSPGVTLKHLQAVGVSEIPGHLRCRVAHLVSPVDLETQPFESAHQELHDDRVSGHGGVHERGVPPRIRHLGIRTVLHQDLHRVQVSRLAGVAQRRASALVREIRARASLQQKSDEPASRRRILEKHGGDQRRRRPFSLRVDDFPIQSVEDEPGEVELLSLEMASRRILEPQLSEGLSMFPDRG